MQALLLFSAAACLVVLAACHEPSANSNQSPPVLSAPPQTNYRMPPAKGAHADLGWTIASEQHVRLSDYQDKVLVLDFYATWCEPCRDSIPHLVELQQRYGPQGLQVIGLNVGGRSDLDKVPAFARKFHIQYQLGVPDSELADLYTGDEGVIPLTVVLDRQGRQVERFAGYDESVDQKLEEIIQKSLAAKAVNSSAQ
jgi:thiol-disulfide isomerase/thioredoxin